MTKLRDRLEKITKQVASKSGKHTKFRIGFGHYLISEIEARRASIGIYTLGQKDMPSP